MKSRHVLPPVLTLLLIGGCVAQERVSDPANGPIGVAAPAIPTPPQPDKLPAPLQVLVIGDSNTEIGYITGETSRLLERQFGYFGSGYHSLNPVVGMGSGYLPYLKIANDKQWQPYAMVPKNPMATKPYISPDGTAVRSAVVGARTDVEFYGSSIDLYWLGSPNAGSFSLAVDGARVQTIGTTDPALETQRTRIAYLPSGWHKLAATVVAGTVTLLGVEARVEAPGGRRAVIHKWGKGWAASGDFLDIEPHVFASALKLLQPDIVVFLLGTNDHNLNGVNRDQFADNMIELSGRVRAALPRAKLLLISTFQVNSPWSNNGLKQYVEILPEVAQRSGAIFWDMSSWFGSWKDNDQAKLMLDGVHVNQAGGAKIAARLKQVLLDLARTPPTSSGTVQEKITEIDTLSGTNANGPGQIAGLKAWWAADGKMALAPDDRVAAWGDLGASRVDAIQHRGGHRPQRIANFLNGKPVVRFDGKSYLVFPIIDTIRTVIVVAKTNATGAALLGHPYFNTRPFAAGVVRPGKLLSANYAAPGLVKGVGYVNGMKKPVADDYEDAIDSPLKEFKIISLISTDNVAAAYIGWGGSWNNDAYWNGDFAEILIYDRALNDVERQSIEKYLGAKYGIGVTS